MNPHKEKNLMKSMQIIINKITSDLFRLIRLKILNKLSDDVKEPLMSTHKSLAVAGLEEFNDSIDDSIAAADIMIKKKDNKKER